MKGIFNPAAKLMNTLRYKEKFALIFIVFLLPIIFMMTSNILHVDREFQFTKEQRMGLEYNIVLRSLIQHTHQHRGLSAVYTGGKKELKSDILLKEKEIQADIERVDKIEMENGEIFQVSHEWENIKQDWISLQKEVHELEPKNTFEKHTNIISKMLLLNNHVADKTKLVIQSRLETYYLVDVIVNKLPVMAEYMGQARAIGATVTAKKYLSEEEKKDMLVLSQNIQIKLNNVKSSMEISFRNLKIRDELKDINIKAFDAAIGMVDLFNNEIINTNKIQIGTEEYFKFSTNAIDEIYNLLVAQSNVIDDISREDVDVLADKRNITIAFTLITIAVIIYLFAGFYQSIRGGIAAIEIATSKIAEGDLSERVCLEAQDETQKIQNALNKMVDTLIANYKQVSEAKLALEKVAHYDHLTGLPNRALFMEKLNEAINEVHRTGKTAALMFIDLDRFKAINDTLGHQMGDVVLKSVAVQLTGIVGDKGTICRLGGDEFTILLPEVKRKEDIERLSIKISEVIGRPWVLNEGEYSIGASVGYTFYPCEAKDAQEMIKKADMAMYEIKQKRKESTGTEAR